MVPFFISKENHATINLEKHLDTLGFAEQGNAIFLSTWGRVMLLKNYLALIDRISPFQRIFTQVRNQRCLKYGNINNAKLVKKT